MRQGLKSRAVTDAAAAAGPVPVSSGRSRSARRRREKEPPRQVSPPRGRDAYRRNGAALHGAVRRARRLPTPRRREGPSPWVRERCPAKFWLICQFWQEMQRRLQLPKNTLPAPRVPERHGSSPKCGVYEDTTGWRPDAHDVRTPASRSLPQLRGQTVHGARSAWSCSSGARARPRHEKIELAQLRHRCQNTANRLRIPPTIGLVGFFQKGRG